MTSKPDLVASFTEEEVIALDRLMAAVRRGDDDGAYNLAQSPAVQSAHLKFLRMRAKAKGAAS